MIIVKVLGGLASQLQQYSNGRLIADYLNTDLALDITDYTGGYFRPYVLNYLNLGNYIIISEFKKLRKAKLVKNGDELITIVEHYDGSDFYLPGESEEYRAFFNKYPFLYTQSGNSFFRNIDISGDSRFINDFSRRIEGHFSIGVHVRLGDFCEIGWNDSFENYKSALGFILKKHPLARVYFFSNEIEKASQIFGKKSQFIYIDYQNGLLGDIEELFSFAMCDAKVLTTRSGYSRYAAYIGQEKYRKNENVCINDNKNHRDCGDLLSRDELIEGYHYYIDNYENGSNKVQEEFNVIGREYKLEPRYDTLMFKNSCDSNTKLSFWTKYYERSALLGNRVAIASFEKYTGSIITPMFDKACMMSRLGADVLYISLRNERKIEHDAIIQATDLDGNEFEFKMYLCSKPRIFLKSILSKWNYGEGKNPAKMKVIRDGLSFVIYEIKEKVKFHLLYK